MPILSFSEFAMAAIIMLLLVTVVLLFFMQAHNRSSSDFVSKTQAEITGKLAQMSQYQVLEQDKLAQAVAEQKLSLLKIVDEKLMQISQNVGAGLQQSADKTNETLTALRERLTAIDAAQQKISALSEQVVSLQEILSNKQARGAFGEIQMQDLISSVLPPSVYDFQVVLSNQKRADCVLKLPNPPGTIVIDSKFPLESWQALQNASSERDKTEAERFFRSSVIKHIKDIAEKYIIAGETAESALMFLPAESVYAELHAHFADVLETSYRAKVWIVSPTTLMATLNTIRAILKDAKMREQADVIQKEVGCLLEDIKRLDERVDNLSKHFDAAGRDIADIKISSAKISRRVDKIEEIEFGKNEPSALIEQKNAV